MGFSTGFELEVGGASPFDHRGDRTRETTCNSGGRGRRGSAEASGTFTFAEEFSGWACAFECGRNFVMLGTILIVVLLLLLLGAWPAWPYSANWGYYPSGTLGLVLVIVLVLALMGRV